MLCQPALHGFMFLFSSSSSFLRMVILFPNYFKNVTVVSRNSHSQTSGIKDLKRYGPGALNRKSKRFHRSFQERRFIRKLQDQKKETDPDSGGISWKRLDTAPITLLNSAGLFLSAMLVKYPCRHGGSVSNIIASKLL